MLLKTEKDDVFNLAENQNFVRLCKTKQTRLDRKQNPRRKSQTLVQGDPIGRFFDDLVIVYFRQFKENE
jgi:hypothetical protein